MSTPTFAGRPGFDLWETVEGLREALHSNRPTPRMGRGDVRTAILVSLAEEPMHGYQVIQAIETRSNGAWKPSPGSVYPTLQLLADEGLVSASEVGDRKIYTLTEAGREVAVEAVGRDVELTVLEPAGKRRVRPVERLSERLGPVQLASLLGPVRIGVFGRAPIDGRIIDVCLCAKRVGGRIARPVKRVALDRALICRALIF